MYLSNSHSRCKSTSLTTSSYFLSISNSYEILTKDEKVVSEKQSENCIYQNLKFLLMLIFSGEFHPPSNLLNHQTTVTLQNSICKKIILRQKVTLTERQKNKILFYFLSPSPKTMLSSELVRARAPLWGGGRLEAIQQSITSILYF